MAEWVSLSIYKLFARKSVLLISPLKGTFSIYSRIPGIDEATALASAIGHIESGKYDLIVFDTAPTGHTLKLLALPDIIQVNLDFLNCFEIFW